MALKKARSPVVWIRRLLLVVGLLGVAALSLMLVAYRFGRSGLEDDAAAARTAAPTDQSTVTAGEGFTFVHTIEGRQIFSIRAEKSLQDRQDTTYLETVILDIFREDGETYRVTSNQARVNETTREARLEGNVVVSGWGDLELEARAFDLQHEGQLLVSRGAVQFRYPPDLEGRATSLRLDRRTDTINLSGGVHVRSAAGSETPTRLDCERLVYKRGEGMIRALDDVFIRYGDRELSTRALTLFLLDDGRTLDTLRARWDVVGAVREATDYGGESRIEFRGELLELESKPGEGASREIRLEGPPGAAATVKLLDADGLARVLSARVLKSQTVAGRPAYIQGTGDPLIIDEYLDLEVPYPLRKLCAREANALFLADGSLSRILLKRQVELSNSDVHLAGGSEAVLELESGRLEVQGPSVELLSSRGDLAAPRIVYWRDRGLIRAESGVRATLEPETATALARTPFARGQGPIHVESSEAFYTSEPPAFTFQGGVRAWREENLLMADELRGDQAARQMSASGGVRTLWLSAPRPNAAAAQPIEVRSDLLTFRQEQDTVVYSGKVRVEQEGRTLTCRELAVELDGGRGAKRMICRDDVRLDEETSRRRVLGDVAVYTVAEDRIEIYGDRVRLIDAESNKLEGRYLVYDLGADTVEISSRTPAAGPP